MIKGNAKMEFGTGDILVTACLASGIGALCCINQETHAIGELVSLDSRWSPDESDVILTFTKPESIDALIAELRDLRAMMDKTYDFSKCTVADKDINLDTFTGE